MRKELTIQILCRLEDQKKPTKTASVNFHQGCLGELMIGNGRFNSDRDHRKGKVLDNRLDSRSSSLVGGSSWHLGQANTVVSRCCTVSYTHLTLPTNREV